MYLAVSESSEFDVKVSTGIILPSATPELFGYNRSCDVMLLLFIGCFGFNL